MDYPNKHIFNNIKDEKGNTFFNGYVNKETTGVLSYQGKNLVFKGNPKIVIRTGDKSIFGEELIIELKILEVIKGYKQNTNHDTMEIYFPKNEGIEFLKEFIKEYEKNNKYFGV